MLEKLKEYVQVFVDVSLHHKTTQCVKNASDIVVIMHQLI